MATPTQLKKVAASGLLYEAGGRRLRLGSKAKYNEVRDYIEDMYDHEGPNALHRVKPHEIPTQNVKVHNYRNLYFVVDKDYKYMHVYVTTIK